MVEIFTKMCVLPPKQLFAMSVLMLKISVNDGHFEIKDGRHRPPLNDCHHDFFLSEVGA